MPYRIVHRQDPYFLECSDAVLKINEAFPRGIVSTKPSRMRHVQGEKLIKYTKLKQLSIVRFANFRDF